MKKDDHRDIFRNLSLVLQIGLTVIVPTMLLTFLGVWLDRKFGTWFTIPLVLFGISGGVMGAWSLIRRSNSLKDEPKETYDLMNGWKEEGQKKDESSTEKSDKEVSGTK